MLYKKNIWNMATHIARRWANSLSGAKVVFEMDHDGYTWHDLEVFLTRKDPNAELAGL